MAHELGSRRVPFFRARPFAKGLLEEIDQINQKARDREARLQELGVLTVVELEERRRALELELVDLTNRNASEQQRADEAAEEAKG